MPARPTLTGAGYVLATDAQYNSNRLTGSGLAAPPGARFVAARVVSVVGGSSPSIQIRNGKSDQATQVRTVAATNGATIDQRATPDPMPDGCWLTVAGNPTRIEVEVLWR